MEKKFLKSDTPYNDSKFIIVPCPYEKTTSYGKGAKNGPKAILEASRYLENFDHEQNFNPSKHGIHTLKPVPIANIEYRISNIASHKKTPIILGGEHSLSVEAVKALKKTYPDLSVLQFDAHADLRDEYEGRKNSHACAMRRILEICPAVQVGIRSISEEEWHFANSFCQINKIHFRESIIDIRDLTKKVLSQLSNHVYITFDVDVFDPSIMPSTGTPEPGGMLWYETLDILKDVCAKKKVIGADFVELMPIKGLSAPDFTAAKLVYKTIAYISRAL